MKNLSKQFFKVFLLGVFLLFSNKSISQCGPLSTPYLDNNGQSGIMFDIVALQSVNITQLGMDFTTGSFDMEIYFIPGTHVGNETNAAAWTLLGTVNGWAATGGTNVLIPIFFNQFLCAGDVGGFYVTASNSTGGNYYNGTGVGNVSAADANIQILEGTGKAYPFGTNFTPRVPNVTVFYDCMMSCCLPPTMTMTPETCVGSCDGTATATVGAGGVAPYTYAWDAAAGNQTTQTAVGLCAGTYNVNVTDNTGCVSTNSITVTSGAASANATITPSGPYCEFDAAFNLSAVDPGGTWSGTGITDAVAGTFNPNVSGVGTHTVTYTIAGPCGDSQTTDIVVSPVYNLIEAVNACENSTLTYPDGTTATITSSTSYTSNLLSTAGCDSIIVTNVTMNPVYNTTETINACENTTVTYPDGTTATITSSTSYTSNLTTIYSCDSVVVTNVTMDPVFAITEDFDICTGSDFTFPDGTTHTNIVVAETYISNMVTALGCDSIITTNITISSAFAIIENFTICEGTDYTYPDGTVSTNILVDESHISTFISALGCDSLVTTNITVNPIYNVVEVVNTCENTTVTYPDGTTATITASTSYTSNLSTVAGCDSVVVTSVTMDPVFAITEDFDICTGSDYTYPDGTTHTNIVVDETYISNMVTALGCDSIITTNITINSAFTTSENFTICEGTDYTYPDGTVSTNILVDESHVSTFVSALGCDSLVTTNITVNPIYNVVEAVNTCENATVTYPDGTTATITASTSYTSNLSTVAGCDSIIVTNVTMEPIYNIVESVNACENTMVTYPDGTTATITSSTSYTSNLTSAAGCDSIVVTNVTMDPLPLSGTNGAITYCPTSTASDLYTQLGGVANIGGAWSPALASGTGMFDPSVDAAGTYTYTVTNNCGTISSDVVVSITANPNPGTNGLISFCATDPSYDLFGELGGNPDLGGMWSPTLSSGTGVYNPSTDPGGIYTYSITTSCGVYSSQVDVTLNATDDATFNYPTTVYCINSSNPSATIIGTSGGTFTISGGGVIDPITGEIDIIGSGIGGYGVTYTTNGPCPDVFLYDVTILDIDDASFSAVGPFCAYDAPVQLVPVQTGGVWSGQGVDPITGVFDPSLANGGVNTITYTIPGLCGDAQSIQIDVTPTPTVTTISDTTVTAGNPVDLITIGSGGNYTWSPSSWLDCDNCQNPITTPEDPITYTVTLEENGCISSDEVIITVIYDPVIFVPNIFSPNGDGNNDVLYVRARGINIHRFVVYDRWGEKVFESSSLEEGWDGNFRGKKLNPAVFMYYVEYVYKGGDEEVQVIKGDVTIIH